MKLVDRLDAIACEIIDNYSPAIRQLHEWVGGYPASTIGASPPTGPTPTDDDTSDTRTDTATRTITRMQTLLTRLAETGRTMWAEHDGHPIPEPADTDPARLAVMMWTVRRTQRDPKALSTKKLESYGRRMQALADLCHIHQPPEPPVIIDCCHAHKTADLEAAIDPHYRRWHLCRWCGDFRTLHRINPPPKLVRLHDRGVRMTTTLLRSAGVRVT